MYRGTVTAVKSQGAMIKVPHLAPGAQFGPCDVPTDLVLAKGDRVLVAQIEEVKEDLVIVAKIGG